MTILWISSLLCGSFQATSMNVSWQGVMIVDAGKTGFCGWTCDGTNALAAFDKFVIDSAILDLLFNSKWTYASTSFKISSSILKWAYNIWVSNSWICSSIYEFIISLLLPLLMSQNCGGCCWESHWSLKRSQGVIWFGLLTVCRCCMKPCFGYTSTPCWFSMGSLCCTVSMRYLNGGATICKTSSTSFLTW